MPPFKPDSTAETEHPSARLKGGSKSFREEDGTIMALELDLLFQKSPLIPVIIQDEADKTVLMLGFTNREALNRTLESGTAWFWSRSRQKLWNKGETSGNFLHVKKIMADCDSDSLLYLCAPDGPTCHTGARSCFFQPIELNQGA